MWIIDFGVDTPLEEAAQYEMPFEYVRQHVKPVRDKVTTSSRSVRNGGCLAKPARICDEASARL